MLTAGDVMTRRVVTLSEDDDLALAESILALGRIRHLPVTRAGVLVGLVTQRNILEAVERTSRPLHAIRASEAMTRELITVAEDTSLSRTARVVLAHKLGCVPVVDDYGVVVGIVTEADLVRLASRLVDEMERGSGAAAET